MHGKNVSFFNWHDCQLPGKALEKANDCSPNEFVPGAKPKTQDTARTFDQAFTKLHKDKYDVSVVRFVDKCLGFFVFVFTRDVIMSANDVFSPSALTDL